MDDFVKKVNSSKKIKSKKSKNEKKTILYAPTFSPKYKSSSFLFNSIKKAQKYEFNWLVKFHNLEKESVVKNYETLSSDYFKIIEDDNILNLMESADILITDTSSVAYEYLLFNRPIITYKAETRFEKGLNIVRSDDLIGAIVRSIEDPDEFKQSRDEILNDIHPYQDGKSSKRLVETISDFIKNKEFKNLKRKPRNWYRKMQIRKIVSS